MEWLFILFAVVFEVAWPFVLKWSAASSRWSPLLAVLLFTPSAFLLGEAVKRLPAATVYAAFTGLATAATAIVGMVFYGESANLGRICCLAGCGKIPLSFRDVPWGQARNPWTLAKPLISHVGVLGFWARGQRPRPGITACQPFSAPC